MVFIFIFATVGLLIYAAVRPWVQKWAEVRVLLRIEVALTHLLLRVSKNDEAMPQYQRRQPRNRNTRYSILDQCSN